MFPELLNLIGSVAAALSHIENAELLAALPIGAGARQRHLIALRILEEVREEVDELWIALQTD
jgi:hypothetical protein